LLSVSNATTMFSNKEPAKTELNIPKTRGQE